MGSVLEFPQHQARASSGHKSGRSSVRDTPVSRSIDKTNSAGTPRFDFSSQYQTWDCVVPMRSAKGFCPPASSQARLSASFDMGAQYPNLGQLQPKNLSEITYRNFGNHPSMKEVDSKAFGRRVLSRRKELGIGQTKLGELSGYSQSNIGWIEQGKAKDPKKQVLNLTDPLQTTVDWLLWEEGPKSTGPQPLSKSQLSDVYDDLPLEIRMAITEAVNSAPAKKAKKKKRA